jgi:hypothetical protein
VTDLVPPSLDMWVFAGAGAGALLTWLTMRVAGGSAYQHGYDHGVSENNRLHEARIAALERERAQLEDALARAREERARLLERLAGTPLAAGDPGPAPAPRG